MRSRSLVMAGIAALYYARDLASRDEHGEALARLAVVERTVVNDKVRVCFVFLLFAAITIVFANTVRKVLSQ